MARFKPSIPVALWVVAGLGFLGGLHSAQAQSFSCTDIPMSRMDLDEETTPTCSSGGTTPVCKCLGLQDLTFCVEPTVEDQSIQLVDPSCDPNGVGGCAVEIRVRFKHPGNEQTIEAWDPDASPTPYTLWYATSEPPDCDPTPPPFPLGDCPAINACGTFPVETESDVFESAEILGAVTCENALSIQRSVTAFGCPIQANGPLCRRKTDVPGLGGVPLARAIGCELPPEDECDECEMCPASDSGASTGGGGPSVSPGDSGAGAFLRYRAGGAGHPGFPGSSGVPTPDWNEILGRYWSHDYAERIVEDPDETHVWLITKFGSFRQFSDLVGDTYTTNSPSDEYRTLKWLNPGWELHDLDGTVQSFDANGFWTQTVDRNGNAKTATYNASNQLEEVDFADERSEIFTYYSGHATQPDGRLESITEVGVDGTSMLTWIYTWTGMDLTRIDRPDGTAWEFFYDDPSFPGYMTRMELVGTDASRRVERAWEYDASGNVTKTWEGDASSTGPDAVDLWNLSYDNAALPAETTVTDPLNEVTVFTIDRDPNGTKPRLQSIAGSCPVCAIGPNTSFEYNDSANPLLPTASIDENGNRAELFYDSNGRMTMRVEAMGAAEQRTTTWQYDTNFPAFATLVQMPSTSGSGFRETSRAYDPSTGDLTSETISGTEGGGPFALSTATTYSGVGQPLSIDPPGFGGSDQTTFDYTPGAGEPARGSLFPFSRTDPLIGATSFAYDAFNRRTEATDPNAVTTETAYDPLDRVTAVTRDSGSPGQLATQHTFNVFGDLFRTILPEGNVIEYLYDSAGRLESIERKPDAATPGERTFFTLDDAGNRTQEELQSWNGAAWVSESVTQFVYSSRCRLDQVIRDPGPNQSVTEYAYDCNGNLERVWDANHPSAGQTAPATQRYSYDALNRLVEIEQPEGSGTTTIYGYDIQDHLTSVTDAEANVTTYVYSDRDLLTQQVSPASGTTSFVYNEHGELTQETDARGVIVSRVPDELDRVTLVDYPDDTLDTTYTYDDPAVGFSKGRLTKIERNGASVDYSYDAFGRVLQDGALAYTYDDNGNRETITYPAGAVATYTYDFADRQATLTVNDGVNPPQAVVSSSSYEPSGPLTSLVLGNGITETRDFDGRYFPDAIAVDNGLMRMWDYTTDAVGNVLQIVSTSNCTPNQTLSNQTIDTTVSVTACDTVTLGPNLDVEAPGDLTVIAGDLVAIGDEVSVGDGARLAAGTDPTIEQTSTWTYTYEAPEYYLTQANGLWGNLSWTYDAIGNRLSETRDGLTDTYVYVSNGTGNTPTLQEVQLGLGGTRSYTYGPAGHLELVDAGANEVDFAYDDAGRLQTMTRLPGTENEESADLLYDGRSFLSEVDNLIEPGPDVATVEPTYSSEGLLHALRRTPSPTAPVEEISVFYFAGRPVGQLEQVSGASEWTFLTTDHLGTPLLATDLSGLDVWAGPFEPFGEDTFFNATNSGVFLRLPGQWVDSIWEGAALGADVYYNVHRWYEFGTGRYGRRDPARVGGRADPYVYALSSPTVYHDPLGLQAAPPPPPNRDPFQPPIDPQFRSGPWGSRPDPNCCDEDEVSRARQNAQDQIDRTQRGQEPTGTTIGGAIIREHACGEGGWCVPVPPTTPFDPFVSPSITDPCVRYCVRAHEWFHFRDRRPWHLDWSRPRLGTFWEQPAYELEKACLQSFF